MSAESAGISSELKVLKVRREARAYARNGKGMAW